MGSLSFLQGIFPTQGSNLGLPHCKQILYHLSHKGISKLKWTDMGEFNSDDHHIYYCGQESLRRNGVAIIVSKSPNCSTWMQSQKNRMISVCFQGKPFNITVIQVYAPTSNAEEAEVEWFSEDLQDLLELIPQKRYPFHYRELEYKSGKSRNTWSNRKI